MADLPPLELLTPERVQALTELLFEHPLVEGAEAVIEAMGRLQVLRTGWRAQWSIDGATVNFMGHQDEALHPNQLACSCFGPRPCPHALAVALALAWGLPEGRPYFSLPPWELRLATLVESSPAQRGARAPEPAAHEGWIRYHVELLPKGEPTHRLYPWTVRRELIRLARRGERELQPRPCPEAWEAIEGAIVGLGPADRSFHALWAEYEELCALYAARWQAISSRGQRILRELADRMMLALAEVGDVRFEGKAVRMERERISPRLQAEPIDEGVRLRWSPGVARSVDIGTGFVLCDDGVLRPLEATVPRALRGMMGRPLPVVPRAELPGLVERFILGAHLPIELPASPELGVVDADERVLRLRLREEGRELVVEARFAYLWDGVATLVDAEDPAGLVAAEGLPATERVWIRRDRAGERAELAELPLVGGLPARLSGDDALDFLSARLPELGRRMPIDGLDALVAHRVRGELLPRVRVPAGVDGFDLRVDFALDGQGVATRTVLESWLAGRAFVRLADGSLARLPEAWLQEHGHTLAEMEEVRRASAGGLGVCALPLAEPLLGQAEGDVAGWKDVAGRLGRLAELPQLDAPDALRAELRPYQRVGYCWLSWLRELGVGGCLADDMGLGKTVQTLAWLVAGGGPSLVIAPTSVVDNWVREARRFAPGLRVAALSRLDREAPLGGHDLVVASYALLRLDEARLAGLVWRHLVLDEAQNIRNPSSRAFRAACAIPAEHRLALTGTPMENRLLELWSVLQFVNPGFFGSRAAFLARYANPIERRQDERALGELRRRIRPFVLRRLKREVATELPLRQEQTLECELGPEQRALYDRVRVSAREAVLRAMADGDGPNRLHVLEALTRLRQACCDPALLPFPEAREVRGSAKLDLLMETLEEAVADGHRSLIFSQWPSLLERVALRLRERGWPYLLLTGATRERAALVDAFQAEDGPPLFLISLKAGGTGLNLTAADCVFHLDPWWNPAAEDQATDRAHRIGQTRPVMVYRLVARETVEDRILALQEKKRALFSSTLDAERLRAEDLGLDELRIVLDAVDAVRSAERPREPEAPPES